MTGKRMRLLRWIVGVSAAGVLLQTGTCGTQAFNEFVVVPQITALLSDAVFFLLDNALVHLTT